MEIASSFRLTPYIHLLDRSMPPIAAISSGFTPKSNKFDVICIYCGALCWIEEKSSSSTSLDPHFICCDRGSVQLPPFRGTPLSIQQLFRPVENSPEQVSKSKHFLQHIRHFNNAFAFTSLGTNIDNSVRQGRGPYVFRINGSLHHLMGSMLPTEGQPKFLQINFMDGSDNDRVARRSEIHSNLDESIVRSIQRSLEMNNAYMKLFLTTKEIIGSNPDIYAIRLHDVSQTPDPRRYNAPTTAEVAALIVTGPDTSTSSRDLLLRARSTGSLSRVSETHSSYFPLRYPLFFPRGEQGWNQYMFTDATFDDDFHLRQYCKRKRRTERLTIRAFLCFWLHYRNDNAQFHLGKALFQEFVVDSGAIREQQALNFLKNNQRRIRAEAYSGLQDALMRDANTSLNTIGTKVILPSSFPGSIRYMQQLYQDAIALCRQYGKPDYFITITCNPKWPVIADNLMPGQSANDRPDVIARGFHLMFAEFMATLKKEGVFGTVVAYCHTLEFQKRGLPHCHIILIVDNSSKLTHQDQVDEMISAELPDQQQDPHLFDVVMSNMIHGPCGSLNPNSPCMVNGRCTKKYPWSLRDETSIDVDGYPLYRRRRSEQSHTRKGYLIDNTWVVPYNPYLCAKFGAHINVESCRGIKAVKYIYKYIFKGQDRAEYSIETGPGDEIREYVDARYLSPVEACWGIFSFKTHGTFPSVQRLQFHLPNQQSVQFFEESSLATLLSDDTLQQTQLTEFFRVNAVAANLKSNGIQPNPDPTQLLYLEFPSHYVWNPNSKKWSPRKRRYSVGRIYFSHPRQGERYYLRLLLMNIRGPTSFDCLRTVRNIHYETFQEACVAYGLLENCNHWIDTIHDASNFASGHNLRMLFSQLLLMGDVADPLGFYEAVKHELCDDVEYILSSQYGIENVSQELIEQYALFDISRSLLLGIDSYERFHLPPLTTGPWLITDHRRGGHTLEQESDYNIDVENLTTKSTLLNDEQRRIKDCIFDSIEKSSGNMIFIDGPGGSGKTFLINNILDSVRSTGSIALAVASSGIAATLLHGGRTAHSRFKVPLDVNESSTCSISKSTDLAFLISQTQLLIWDEAPMSSKYVVETIERSVRDIRGGDKWFGGLTVCFSGDFRQILPVVPFGSRRDIIDYSLCSSRIWGDVKVMNLSVNMRVQNSGVRSSFGQTLIKIGEGEIEQFQPGPLQMVTSRADLIQKLYNNLDQSVSSEYLSNRAILSSTNDAVDDINEEILNAWPGEESISYSWDKIDSDDPSCTYAADTVSSQRIAGFPLCQLKLKVGVPLILLRNISPAEGLCNGTRLRVDAISTNILKTTILNGSKYGSPAFIPKVSLTHSNGLPFSLTRRQFPVRLAFAMTINKAQGQTLNTVGLDLSTPVFTHGQLYVALSRSTSPMDTRILLPDGNIVQNIVFREIFRLT